MHFEAAKRGEALSFKDTSSSSGVRGHNDIFVSLGSTSKEVKMLEGFAPFSAEDLEILHRSQRPEQPSYYWFGINFSKSVAGDIKEAYVKAFARADVAMTSVASDATRLSGLQRSVIHQINNAGSIEGVHAIADVYMTRDVAIRRAAQERIGKLEENALSDEAMAATVSKTVSELPEYLYSSEVSQHFWNRDITVNFEFPPSPDQQKSGYTKQVVPFDWSKGSLGLQEVLQQYLGPDQSSFRAEVSFHPEISTINVTISLKGPEETGVLAKKETPRGTLSASVKVPLDAAMTQASGNRGRVSIEDVIGYATKAQAKALQREKEFRGEADSARSTADRFIASGRERGRSIEESADRFDTANEYDRESSVAREKAEGAKREAAGWAALIEALNADPFKRVASGKKTKEELSLLVGQSLKRNTKALWEQAINQLIGENKETKPRAGDAAMTVEKGFILKEGMELQHDGLTGKIQTVALPRIGAMGHCDVQWSNGEINSPDYYTAEKWLADESLRAKAQERHVRFTIDPQSVEPNQTVWQAILVRLQKLGIQRDFDDFMFFETSLANGWSSFTDSDEGSVIKIMSKQVSDIKGNITFEGLLRPDAAMTGRKMTVAQIRELTGPRGVQSDDPKIVIKAIEAIAQAAQQGELDGLQDSVVNGMVLTGDWGILSNNADIRLEAAVTLTQSALSIRLSTGEFYFLQEVLKEYLRSSDSAKQRRAQEALKRLSSDTAMAGTARSTEQTPSLVLASTQNKAMVSASDVVGLLAVGAIALGMSKVISGALRNKRELQMTLLKSKISDLMNSPDVLGVVAPVASLVKEAAGREGIPVYHLRILREEGLLDDNGNMPPNVKEAARSFVDSLDLLEARISQSLRGDRAMRAPGGIDLNTSNGMQWKVSKDGHGVEMNIDPAMIERVKREGIDSLSPVIFRITPVTSIWPLVGLQAPR